MKHEKKHGMWEESCHMRMHAVYKHWTYQTSEEQSTNLTKRGAAKICYITIHTRGVRTQHTGRGRGEYALHTRGTRIHGRKTHHTYTENSLGTEMQRWHTSLLEQLRHTNYKKNDYCLNVRLNNVSMIYFYSLASKWQFKIPTLYVYKLVNA